MKDDSGALLLFIFLVLAFKDFGPPDGKSVVYEAYCADRTASAAHCPAVSIASLVQFRADAQTQSVFSLEDGVISRLQNCTVFDAGNWTCDQPGFPQSMSKGDYSAPWETMTTQRVSWVHWQMLRARSFAEDVPGFFKRYSVLPWVMGLTALAAALIVPSSIFRRLVRRFPWMGESDGGWKSAGTWKTSTTRVTTAALVILGLVALAFSILLMGVGMAESLGH